MQGPQPHHRQILREKEIQGLLHIKEYKLAAHKQIIGYVVFQESIDTKAADGQRKKPHDPGADTRGGYPADFPAPCP